MKSNLQTAIESGRFVYTAEITPALSTDPADVIAKAAPLKGYADAVNVVDGASAKVHIDCVAASVIMLNHGVEPILQLTCRDRNRIALQGALVGAHALGIRNVMFLTGDDPKMGDQPEAKAVFDLDSSSLAATARDMRDKREIPSGRKVKGDVDFFIGLTDVPVDPQAKPDWKPAGLAKKVAAGAQFVQTQFCMDADVVRRYTQALKENGINVPLLIGVAPFASGKSARWMKEKLFGVTIPDWMVDRMENASDPKAEGSAICVDFIKQLKEIPGVGGAHVMAPLNEAAIPGVIGAVR